MAKFYWIALASNTEQGRAYDLKGAFNTKEGRDAELVRNSKFWTTSGIEVRPFETEGKKREAALAMAKQVLESQEVPQPVTQAVTPSSPISQRPQSVVRTQTEVADRSLEEEAGALSPFSDSSGLSVGASLEDLAREDNARAFGDIGGSLQASNNSLESDNLQSGGSLLQSAEALRSSTLDIEAGKVEEAFTSDVSDVQQELYGDEDDEEDERRLRPQPQTSSFQNLPLEVAQRASE